MAAFSTDRLIMEKLSVNDNEFIFELVNTPGWLTYIGDRNIHTLQAADNYINKIISDPQISYWTVKLRDRQIAVGLITFIKRDYLDHPDIGFAFLPRFQGQGYAFEAASAVLNSLMENPAYSIILATTLQTNINSIRLLEKLGLSFDRQIKEGKDVLQVYVIQSGEYQFRE